MKKMKRLVAILLASVLALAMLTACGESGSGSKSFAQQVEEAYMQNLEQQQILEYLRHIER